MEQIERKYAVSYANLNLTFKSEKGEELHLRWRFFKTSTPIPKIKDIVSCVLENGSIFSPNPAKVIDVKYKKMREVVPQQEN